MPTMIIVGLMVIPYIDTNPLGSGYYTWKQRKFSISTFLFGFIILWVAMIIIGTFIRGPGWQWFWPGQTWDHNRLIYEVNRDLPDLFGITSNLGKGNFRRDRGRRILSGRRRRWCIRCSGGNMKKDFQRMSLLQFSHDAVLVADHGGVAPEDGAAAVVAHQVCVDYAVVQRVKNAAVV